VGKNSRVFSLYDVEQFLREAGAMKVNERAVVSLAQELEDTAKELVDSAQIYATYGGRNKSINGADVRLAHMTKANRAHFVGLVAKRKRLNAVRAKVAARSRQQAVIRKGSPIISYNAEKNILY